MTGFSIESLNKSDCRSLIPHETIPELELVPRNVMLATNKSTDCPEIVHPEKNIKALFKTDDEGALDLIGQFSRNDVINDTLVRNSAVSAELFKKIISTTNPELIKHYKASIDITDRLSSDLSLRNLVMKKDNSLNNRMKKEKAKAINAYMDKNEDADKSDLQVHHPLEVTVCPDSRADPENMEVKTTKAHQNGHFELNSLIKERMKKPQN